MVSLSQRPSWGAVLLLATAMWLHAAPSAAQSGGGFVYALNQINGPNEVHGFSVDPATGALTAVAGSPFPTGGTGGFGLPTPIGLAYDRVNDRLYAINDGTDTVSVFAVNRRTGALTLLPFSPIPLPPVAADWSCVAVSPDGSILVAGAAAGGYMAPFLVTSTGVTPAAGGPYSVTGFAAYCEFSRDGRQLYVGPYQGLFHGFAVNRTNGSLVPLTGSPFNGGGTAATAFASEGGGRLFMTDFGTGQIQVYASSETSLSHLAGPFDSGLGELSAVRGIFHPAGGYIVADRADSVVGVYTVGGSGASTTVTPVTGSPVATGGSMANTLALDESGSLLFVGHLSSQNIQTFRIDTGLALTSLSLQPAGTVGSGKLTGLVYVPAALPLQIVEYPVPGAGRPRGITVGPDGNLWFTESSGNNIGRITPSGTITQFPIPTVNSVSEGITLGPDGNLWFAESAGNKIGRVTPSGIITEFPLPVAASQPSNLAVGNDGHLWFTEFTGDRIGRITTAGVITEFPLASGSGPFGITNGPDGNLWYTLLNGNAIGRITTAGVATTFPLSGLNNAPFDITTGPDGALWFTKNTTRGYGRITTSGSISEWGGPSFLTVAGITQGPDGNLWSSNQTVERLMPLGSVTDYVPPNPAGGGHITTGPDGNMWYAATGVQSNRIGVVLLPKVSLSVVKNGSGSGVVTGTVGSLERISCGQTCTAPIAVEAVVTLVATPAAGSLFTGWSGAACSGTTPCVLPLTQATSVTATFSQIPAMALAPSVLNFGANTVGNVLQFVTPAQTLVLTQTAGSAAAWTATANQPWITLAPSSGTGPAMISVSINNTNGVLPPNGSLSGQVTISAAGLSSPMTSTVNLTVRASTLLLPFGVFDAPADGLGGVTGSIGLTGWALDDLGVNRLRIMRDPVAGELPGGQVFIGDAVFVAGARPDVAAAFPTYPFHDRAGWGLMVLTNFLPNQGNGTFTFYAYADGLDGDTKLLGIKTITCTNATATAPFGAIDTPAQGGIASGAAFLNYGWALTPQPKSIPADGSTITVYLDSAPIGTLTSYNNARPDIQALFPGYANTDGAVGFKVIDTTTLTNGVHTIAWVVTDNAGAAAGIGSRFFAVSNSTVSGSMTATISRSSDMTRALPITRTTSSEAVLVRRGFDDGGQAEVVAPGPDGVRHVSTLPGERLTVEFGSAASYRGYSIVDGERRSLPVGSTLERQTGRFLWAPPLAFGGTHALVFERELGGHVEELRVDVSIELPAAGGRARMHIDLPTPAATVDRSFTVAGWALDPNGPPDSTGIDTLHVWAYPIDGGAPVWIGAARPGGVRPDVARYYGSRFLRSGFAIDVAALPRGTYDVVVYAHSIAGNWFSVAQAVRVSVR